MDLGDVQDTLEGNLGKIGLPVHRGRGSEYCVGVEGSPVPVDSPQEQEASGYYKAPQNPCFPGSNEKAAQPSLFLIGIRSPTGPSERLAKFPWVPPSLPLSQRLLHLVRGSLVPSGVQPARTRVCLLPQL